MNGVLTKEAAMLLGVVIDKTCVYEWHNGRFTLPDDFEVHEVTVLELLRKGMIDLSWGDHLKTCYIPTSQGLEYKHI